MCGCIAPSHREESHDLLLNFGSTLLYPEATHSKFCEHIEGRGSNKNCAKLGHGGPVSSFGGGKVVLCRTRLQMGP